MKSEGCQGSRRDVEEGRTGMTGVIVCRTSIRGEVKAGARGGIPSILTKPLKRPNTAARTTMDNLLKHFLKTINYGVINAPVNLDLREVSNLPRELRS